MREPHLHESGALLAFADYRLKSLKLGDVVTEDWKNRAIPWRPGMNNPPRGIVFDLLNPHCLRIAITSPAAPKML